MTALGVIAARGGSKGISRKNVVPVAGRPLIGWTCEAACQSRKLTRVVLSTDDREIAAAAAAWGVPACFPRPAALATDEALIVDVLVDLLRTLDGAEQYRPDAVVLLQPTSPLRTAAHIDAAVDLLDASGADTVVSVVTVPHQFNPASVMRVDGERLVPFLAGPTVTRRQDKPALVARNGPAVLAVRRDVLLDSGLYGRDVRPLFMTPEESVDIDGPLDLEIAAFLLARRQGASGS